MLLRRRILFKPIRQRVALESILASTVKRRPVDESIERRTRRRIISIIGTVDSDFVRRSIVIRRRRRRRRRSAFSPIVALTRSIRRCLLR